MRKSLILLPVALAATPAFAQPAPPPPPPHQLADPAIVDRVTDAAQALSQALLDLRVGGLKAAAEGREATPAERNMTVRDLAHDPDLDRKIDRQIAEARPKIRQGMKALNETLPVVMQDIERAQRSVERALSNLPDPTYPQR